MIAAVISMALIVVALYASTVKSSRDELEQIQTQMVELTEIEALYVRTKMADIISRGKNLALAVSEYEDITSSEAEKLISDTESSTVVTDLFVTLPDNSVYFTGEMGSEIFDQLDFQNALSGEASLSDVFTLKSGVNIFAMSIPIQRNGAVIGAVTGIYETRLISELLDVTCFDGEGYMHIFQKDGRFVVKAVHSESINKTDSFFFIENASFQPGYSFEEFMDNILENKNGFLEFAIGGESNYAFYTPVGEYDWYIVTVIPRSVIQYYADESAKTSLILLVEIVLVVFGLLVCVMVDTRKRQKELVLANERLNLSEERFRIAMSHVPYLVFEYHFGDRKIQVLNNQRYVDGILPGNDTVSILDFANTVYEEDLDRVKRLFLEIEGGTTAGTVYFRMRPENETDYRWFNLVLSSVLDKKGKVFRAVGTLEDVNDQRTETLKLRVEADTDALTGIYNRAATERLIENELSNAHPDTKYAFMLIDLDHFKEINDTLGHLYGDEVLKEVATALYTTFRSNDIVGRLGGDEFIVFLTGVGNLEIVKRKLKKPLTALSNPDTHKGIGIKLSVGVVFGKAGDTFMELYRKGDTALYNAKQQGRDRIVLLDEQEAEEA